MSILYCLLYILLHYITPHHIILYMYLCIQFYVMCAVCVSVGTLLLCIHTLLWHDSYPKPCRLCNRSVECMWCKYQCDTVLIGNYRLYGRACFLHIQGSPITTSEMEAPISSEMSWNINNQHVAISQKTVVFIYIIHSSFLFHLQISATWRLKHGCKCYAIS